MNSFYFGDSFIGIFTLIKNINVNKYKGATAKGLLNSDNPNRIHILQVCKNNKINCAVFNFGSVDIHFTIYRKLILNDGLSTEKSIYEYLENTIRGYVQFISELPNITNKIIICPYYNPIDVSLSIVQLLNYGVITLEELNNVDIKKFIRFFKKSIRTKIVNFFNRLLSKYSKKYNIKVININNEIAVRGTIKPEYIDISKVNIHLLWEPLIINIYRNKLRICGVSDENLNIDRNKYEEYIIYKNNI